MSRWSPYPRFRLYTTPASYVPELLSSHRAVEQFEDEICRKFNVAAAVCVPMARTGLYLALLETIRPGQKVILSPLTIVDVVNAVLLAGGVPVFCDIKRDSCSIDAGEVESLIDSDTGAVLITHLHGETAGAQAFRSFCRRASIPLIEDAAQAFGAVEQGRHLGTIGDIGIYSFGRFKNLSTWRGGMVVSRDRRLIERIRRRVRAYPQLSRLDLLAVRLSGMLIDIGTSPAIFSNLTYPIVRKNAPGISKWLDPEFKASRLNDFPEKHFHRMRECQASLASWQLRRVDANTSDRMVRAQQYHAGLGNIPELIVPANAADGSNIYTYFPVQLRNRSELLQHARKHGRDFAAQHLRNCADLPDFEQWYRNCPNARAAAAELILLPAYPRYPELEVKRNIEVVTDFINQRRELSSFPAKQGQREAVRDQLVNHV